MLLSQIMTENGPAVVVRDGSEAAIVRGVASIESIAMIAESAGQSVADTVQSCGLGSAVDLSQLAAEGKVLDPAAGIARVDTAAGLAQICYSPKEGRAVHLGWALAFGGAVGPEVLVNVPSEDVTGLLRHCRGGAILTIFPFSLPLAELVRAGTTDCADTSAGSMAATFFAFLTAGPEPESTRPGDRLELEAAAFGLPLTIDIPAPGQTLRRGAPTRA